MLRSTEDACDLLELELSPDTCTEEIVNVLRWLCQFVTRHEGKPVTRLRKEFYRKIESPWFEERLKKSIEMQRWLVAMLSAFEGRGRVKLADLMELFDEQQVFGIEDPEDRWEDFADMVRKVLELIYLNGILNVNLDEHDLLDQSLGLFRQIIYPSSYFVRKTDEEVMLSRFCLRMEVVSEEIMNMAPVGKILLDMMMTDCAYTEERIIACLQTFQGLCNLLPGTGFDFRGFLGLGQFGRSFLVTYVKDRWEKLANDKKFIRGPWEEMVDYETGRFYHFNAKTSESVWKFSSEQVHQPLFLKGLEAAFELMLTLNYEQCIQNEMRERDFTDMLLCSKFPPGRFHSMIAWLLLFNVSCCFSKSKKLLNKTLIDEWLGNLGVCERSKIIHAFLEQARSLPSQETADCETYTEMYELIVRPRAPIENPETWIYCTDHATGHKYFARTYLSSSSSENGEATFTQWDRPCVTATSWCERLDQDGNVYYEYYTGYTQWDYPIYSEDKLEAKSLLGELPALGVAPPKRALPPPSKPKHPPTNKVRAARRIAPSMSRRVAMSPARAIQEMKTCEPSSPEDSFKCALSQRMMMDPVVTPSGHTFERKAITAHLAKSNVCPTTGLALQLGDLMDDTPLRERIILWHIREQQRKAAACFETTDDLYDF